MIKALTLFLLLLVVLFTFQVMAASQGSAKPQSPINSKTPCSRYKMPIIKPDENVDYKLHIVKPAEVIDYKGIVIDPCKEESQGMVKAKPLIPGLGKKDVLSTPLMKSLPDSSSGLVKTPSEILKDYELRKSKTKVPQ
jgi:hypothetical protein